MGEESALWGCIFGTGRGPERDELMQHNARVIESLPANDPYPHLTRNMFHVVATEYGEPGLYKFQMIPFGASCKDLADSWDIWLRKFERLLRQLQWERADVHLLLTGRFAQEQSYTWRPHIGGSGWTFSGGPREFGDVLQRHRDWIPEAERQILENPEDSDLMGRLVSAYDRVGAEDQARELFERLRVLDPARAAIVEWI